MKNVRLRWCLSVLFENPPINHILVGLTCCPNNDSKANTQKSQTTLPRCKTPMLLKDNRESREKGI